MEQIYPAEKTLKDNNLQDYNLTCSAFVAKNLVWCCKDLQLKLSVESVD